MARCSFALGLALIACGWLSAGCNLTPRGTGRGGSGGSGGSGHVASEDAGDHRDAGAIISRDGGMDTHAPTGTGGQIGSAGSSNQSNGVDADGGGDSSTGGHSDTNASAGSSGTAGASGGSGSSIKPVTCATDDTPVCGNGVVDPGESCDGPDLRGLSCIALDPFFTGGTLGCGTNCSFDTGRCTHGSCGNGVLDPGEDCEYADASQQKRCNEVLPGSDDTYNVACSASTCRYDISHCANAPAAVCGNGKREADEECDGDDRGWRSCTELDSLRYTGGQLRCDPATCTFDRSQCEKCDGARCGDGLISPDEECDGDNLGSHTCADDNRASGEVHCLSNCRVDYGQCHGGCTVYKGKIINCN